VKTRVRLEGEELERYLEKEKEKEKSRPVTDATDRRYIHSVISITIVSYCELTATTNL